MRVSFSQQLHVYTGQLSATTKPDKLSLGWVQKQTVRGHPTREGINSTAHQPNRGHRISRTAVDIRLYIISIKLMQQPTRPQQGANIRCIKDVQQRAQNRPLGYTKRGRDPTGPRGPNNSTVSAPSEE